MPHFLGHRGLVGWHRFRLVPGVVFSLRAVPLRRDLRLDFLDCRFDGCGRRRQRHGVTLMLHRADRWRPIRLALIADVRRHNLAATVVAAFGDKSVYVIQ